MAWGPINREALSNLMKNGWSWEGSPSGVAGESCMVEKNVLIEALVAENLSLLGNNPKVPEKQITVPHGFALQLDAKVLVRISPHGSMIAKGKSYIATDEVIREATCTLVNNNLIGKVVYTFAYDDAYLYKSVDTGDEYKKTNRLHITYYDGGTYTAYIGVGAGYPSGASAATGDLALDVSVIFDTPASAHDGLTLWSDTEDSIKRFVLSVDDNAAATLTDVETGEIKGLGGGLMPNVIYVDHDNDAMTYTLRGTFAEAYDMVSKGYATECHVVFNYSGVPDEYGCQSIYPLVCCEDGFMQFVYSELIPDRTGTGASPTIAGHYLTITADGVSLEEVFRPSLPQVTKYNNGSFLRVVDGAWSVASIANGEEASF